MTVSASTVGRRRSPRGGAGCHLLPPQDDRSPGSACCCVLADCRGAGWPGRCRPRGVALGVLGRARAQRVGWAAVESGRAGLLGLRTSCDTQAVHGRDLSGYVGAAWIPGTRPVCVAGLLPLVASARPECSGAVCLHASEILRRGESTESPVGACRCGSEEISESWGEAPSC
jgi:hypothetical protein